MNAKERLEIIKFLRNSEKTVTPGMQPSELISRKDVDWLINRVEELEETIADYAYEIGKRKRALNKKTGQNKRYRESIEVAIHNMKTSSDNLGVKYALKILEQALEGRNE